MLVIVADDYDSTAEIVAELIGLNTPYEALPAVDGVEVLQLASQRRPDACILDVDMPRIGGIEAARRLREMFGEQRPLLIAVSGKSADRASFSGEFDHVLTKPVELDTLIEFLGRM